VTLYSSVIDTLSSGTAFNFLNTLVANLNIATNGTTGQTIRIGATTGASVHCANIDHQGNSINNSTNASGGTINLCNSMTSGTLNVGTNTARSGNVNIGNGVGATGTVFIGSSTSPTTVGGTLTSTGQITASNGLTLGAGKYITTNVGASGAGLEQIGEIITGSSVVNNPTVTSGRTTSVSSVVLTAGTWIVTASRQIDSTGS